MKTLQKKLPKDCPITFHVNANENKFLRIRKRQTGLSIGEIIRSDWLSAATELFFQDRKNGRGTAASAPVPVQ